MNYIDPVKYSELLAAFSKGTAKQVLKESVDEKKEMTPKQKKLAALAPPPDKITRADVIVGATKGKKEEGMHLGQPTAPAITTVEGKRDFSNLLPEERDQLKQLIESVKTIKQEIKKLMEKATMKQESGDNTNNVLVAEEGPSRYADKMGLLIANEHGEELKPLMGTPAFSKAALKLVVQKIKDTFGGVEGEKKATSFMNDPDEPSDYLQAVKQAINDNMLGDEDAAYDKRQADLDMKTSAAAGMSDDDIVKISNRRDTLRDLGYNPDIYEGEDDSVEGMNPTIIVLDDDDDVAITTLNDFNNIEDLDAAFSTEFPVSAEEAKSYGEDNKKWYKAIDRFAGKKFYEVDLDPGWGYTIIAVV